MLSTWKFEVGKGFILLANLVAGGLVFGQLITEETDINWIIFVIGAFATLGLYTSSVKLLKDYDRTRRLYRIPGGDGSRDSLHEQINQRPASES